MRRCACWPANIGSGRPEPLEPVTLEPRVPWPTHRNPRISKKLRDTEPQYPGTRQSNNVRQEEADAWGLTAADRAAGMTRLRETAPLQSRAELEPPDPAPPVSLLPEPGFEQGQVDAAHAALAAGLHVAARGRPPSWADPTGLPSHGCFCTCCKGQRWWRECEAPKGWRGRGPRRKPVARRPLSTFSDIQTKRPNGIRWPGSGSRLWTSQWRQVDVGGENDGPAQGKR